MSLPAGARIRKHPSLFFVEAAGRIRFHARSHRGSPRLRKRRAEGQPSPREVSLSTAETTETASRDRPPYRVSAVHVGLDAAVSPWASRARDSRPPRPPAANEVSAAARVKVDQLRDLQASIRYRPYLAKKKVCIIDQAERMNTSSANSILKTLEEPPADTIIILVSSSLDQILPTIRSRCRTVQFSPLLIRDLERLITEKMALPPDKARVLAILADGSIGRAQGIDLATLQERREGIFELMKNLGSSADY